MPDHLVKSVNGITSEIKEEVDRLIFSSLPTSHPVKEIQLLYDMMREYPSRTGKGLRPTLCVLFCQAFGGDRNLAIPTAAALELFQNWIVIHDDIEDQSELRRGKPALHQEHGIALAINAGDALAGRMWEMLLSNRKILDESIVLKLFSLFLEMLNRTTSGQHIELSWVENCRWDLNEEDYMNMCRNKTAYYTCVVPMVAGAFIAGYDEASKDNAERFGLNLGTAFQIRDDILNLVGDEAKYGKEILGDIFEGKRTLMVIHCLQHASDEDKQGFLSIMSKSRHKKGESDVYKIMEYFEKYGSIGYARNSANSLAKLAKKQFEEMTFPGSTEAVENLRILIDFMVNRER